jgi:hypothetical protein
MDFFRAVLLGRVSFRINVLGMSLGKRFRVFRAFADLLAPAGGRLSGTEHPQTGPLHVISFIQAVGP